MKQLFMSKTQKDKEKQKLSQEEDIRVVNDILNGNEQSYNIIQKKYRRQIASAIRKMIKDEDDIDDLTQDTFIKIFRALPSYQPSYLFTSWIFRIASNTCIDFLRKKRFTTISLNQQSNNSDDDYILEIEDNSYQPEIELVINERKNILLNAVNELPDNYREIIKLRHNEDLDYKEISERLNLPLGTVKAHLFRARKILLERLKSSSYLFEEN